MAVAGPALIALQAGAALAGGIAEKKAADREGRALDENGRITQLTGEEDVLSAARQSRMEEGAAVAGAAGGGQLSVGSGSIADMIYANAVERQMELLNIRAGASSQAASLRSQASDARSRGRSALFGGVLRAGAAVLQGVTESRNRGRIDAGTTAARDWERSQPQVLGSIRIPKRKVSMGGGL
jgi:hypothetical protein